MEIKELVLAIERLVPKCLAASKWDNVGLLLQGCEPKVDRILVTNDFTRPVLSEMQNRDFVFSYHPPMFTAFKTLNWKNWKDQIIMKCIQMSATIYSPHTALDAIFGGVNDWLCSPFLKGDFEINPIEKCPCTPELQDFYCSIVDTPKGGAVDLLNKKGVRSAFEINGKCWITHESFFQPSNAQSVKRENDCVGYGRIVQNIDAIPIKEAVSRICQLIKLDNVRIAFAENHTLETLVDTIAACPGAGASCLTSFLSMNCNQALFVTGELSHHQILNAVHNGCTVLLCEHSNTERGYLKECFRPSLEAVLKPWKVNVLMAEKDRDPVEIVKLNY